MTIRYVNETAEHRAKRDALLAAEVALRDQREAVAALRRALPSNPVETDYVFREGPANLEKDDPIRDTKLSELFSDGHDELILIHFMFAPESEKGCPMCSMWADGYQGIERHVRKRASFALVAKQEIGAFRRYARTRGWPNLRLLSAHESPFIGDFGMEDDAFGQRPGVSVFTRDDAGRVHHAHTLEASMDGKFRGIDLMSPVYNLFDLLPSGRGDFFPAHED